MSSILPIRGRWRAQVRRRGKGALSRTFDTRREAEAWARRVEGDLERQAATPVRERLTVAEAVRLYAQTRDDAGRPIAPESNTAYMGQNLADDLGPEAVSDLTPARLLKWAAARKKEGAGGYTVNMEISHLGTILRTAGAILNTTLPDVVGAVRPLLRTHQLISGGRRRTRRPVGDELDRVLEWFAAHRANQRDAVELAVWSGLRRGEICDVTWAQLDRARRVIRLTRKHPRATEAVPVDVPLFGRAWEVVERQAQVEGQPRIFPLHKQTLTKSFKTCCDALGIPNLHFHDLRREANHRLEQAGLSRDERKAVLGHLDDAAHDHYVAFTAEELHRKWEKVTRPKAKKK